MEARTKTATAPDKLTERFEEVRRELTGYAYRMLGSAFEAEDAVQETYIRAWRGYERFEGRAALRSWLYRIATNVCLDMLGSRERRARPMDLGPAREPVESNLRTLPEGTWIEPMPGPNHQRKMSSRPESHRSYGGIDCVASSRMSDVSASMSVSYTHLTLPTN